MDSFVPRVLLTKSFIDSHDRAIKTVATALRDSSIEVILVDYEVAADVVRIALDEDVHVIGLSFMSGGQVDVSAEITKLLAEAGADIPVVVGGTIRPFDIPLLEELGVARIFRGGEQLASMCDAFHTLAREHVRTGRT